jgi:uncharacterized protein YbaP (TraB family)
MNNIIKNISRSKLLGILSHFTILVILLAIFLPAQLDAQNRDNYALLWEFQHPDRGEKGYLFGTMHLQDSSVFKFSDQLLPALESSEVFAMEVHPDSIFNDFSMLINDIDFRDRYKKILGKKSYKALNEQLIKIIGVPLDSLTDNSIGGIDSRIRNQISDERTDVETFLDAYLYGISRSFKKTIAGLEDAQDQMTDYNSMTDEDLKQSLNWLIDAEIDDYTSSLDELIDVYVSGDIYEIEKRMMEDSDESKKQMKSRNIVMTNSIDAIVRDKSLFAAVGAAHLPGKNGIIEMLKAQGYTVSKVEPTFNNDVKELLETKSFDFWDNYESTTAGWRLKVPAQQVQDKNKGSAAGMKAFVDMVSGVSVFMMDFDVPEAKKGTEAQLMKGLMDSFASRIDSVTDRTELSLKNGYPFASISGSGKGDYMRFDVYQANDRLYMMGADFNRVKNSKDAALYFFDSVDFFTPQLPEIEMVRVTDSIGAFSILLPDNYTYKKSTVPNPLDPDNSKYDMFLYTGQMPKDSLMYLFRYNDFPIGYHLAAVEDHIDAYKEDLVASGVLINESERGVVKELTTQDMQVTMANGLPARIRLMYRGNRIYVFIAQGYNTNIKVSKNNPFFESFEQLELLDPQLKDIKVDESFSFKFPENFKFEVEESYSNEAEFQRVTDYMGRSDRTGDLYTAAITDLGDYFNIKTDVSKTQYLDDYMSQILADGDSIYIQQSFTTNGIPGREYYISIENSPIAKRYRLFFSGKKIVFLATFQERSRITAAHNDEYFNGFNEKKPSKFDVEKNKAGQLFKDLVSKDTLISNKAYIALDYYEFESTDLDKMIELSKKTYPNDSTYWGTKNMLIMNIGLLQENKSLSHLEEMFKAAKTPVMSRAAILETMPLYKSDEAIRSMLELAKTDLITTDYEDRLVFLDMDYDSLVPITKFGKEILNIQQNQFYRSRTISYFERQVLNDEDGLKFLTSNKDRFKANFIEDAATVLDTALSNAARFYGYDLNSYFSILDTLQIKDAEVMRYISKIAYTDENRNYTNLLAFEYLMKNQDEVAIDKVHEFIDPLFYRYEGMELMVNNNRTDLMPTAYLESQEYALLSVYNSLYAEDYSTAIKFLDSYMRNGEEYFIFQYNYEGEDPDNPENYLAIATKQEIDFEALEMFPVQFADDSFKEDWLTVIEQYFTDLELKAE